MALAVAAGCGGREAGPAHAATDNTVRALIGADPASLSLLGKMDLNSEILAVQITDSLVQYDAHLALAPRVAESWSVSPDHRTLTFHLREGVRWHDGTPVTADDVVFSAELARAPATENKTYASMLRGVEAVEAPDPRTVVVRYSMPTPDFLEAWRLPLLPRHLAGADADLLTGAFARHPVGCGPFRFVSYRPGQEIVLEASPDYWDGRPSIDRLVLKVFPDQRTALQALLLGELDLMRTSPDQWLEAQSADTSGRIGAFVFWPLSVWPVIWKLEGNPFFGDARVRRAMIHALDREEFAAVVAHGQARPAVTTYHPDTEWADPGLRPLAYDRDLAARLLEQAGWIDADGDGVREKDGRPFRFTLLTPESSMQLLQQIAVWQQHSWEQVGLRVDIEQLEWQAFRERRNAGAFDAVSFSLSLTPNPDQTELYHSSARENGFNFYGLHDAEIDRLLDAGRAEWDPARRKEIYRDLQRRLLDEQPLAAVFHFASPTLHDAALEGLTASPVGLWITTAGPRMWRWGRRAESSR